MRTLTDTIPDVPDVSGDWYRTVVTFAADSPAPVRTFMAVFTELGLVLLAAIWALLCWQAWRAGPRRTAPLLLGTAGVVLAYGASEWAKTFLDAERPCRTFADVVIVAAECPPTGDWSFPSNHSSIAGALVAVIALVSGRWALVALPVGAVVAFSRVFVGVHYPHDVVAGFVLGAVVAAAAVVLLRRPAGRVAGRIR